MSPDPGDAATAYRVAAAGGSGSDAASAIDVALAEVESELDGRADLAVAFVGSDYAGSVPSLAADLARVAATSVGVTAQGVIAGPHEFERPDALAVWAARMPGVSCSPLRYPPPTARGQGVPWPAPPPGISGLLTFCDPFSFPAAAFLSWIDDEQPGLPVSGGVASGGRIPGGSLLLLDGQTYSDGAVAVALGGAVTLRHLVSQGCRPIGPPFVVTGVEGNVLRELAGRPAVDRLQEVFEAADAEDRELLQQGLLVGLLLDEHTEDPGTGDFVVRGVMGAEPGGSGLVLGDMVVLGRTVRFHVRDAASADSDLCTLLARVASRPSAGGLLFTCNGRGRGLFGYDHHDAELVSAALGGAPLAGFFAGGEYGPVGARSWLHGFTASLLTFESPPDQ